MLEISGNPAQQINTLQEEIVNLKADLKYYQEKNSYSVARATSSNLQNKMDNGELLDLENHDHVLDWLRDNAYRYDYHDDDSCNHDYCTEEYVHCDTFQEVVDAGQEARSTLGRVGDMCSDDGCDCTSKDEFVELANEAYNDLGPVACY